MLGQRLQSNQGNGLQPGICRRIDFLRQRGADRLAYFQALSVFLLVNKTCLCRSFIELAGLEPATSWGDPGAPPRQKCRVCSTSRTSTWGARNISRNMMHRAVQSAVQARASGFPAGATRSRTAPGPASCAQAFGSAWPSILPGSRTPRRSLAASSGSEASSRARVWLSRSRRRGPRFPS
jgi:hypothetical protein